MLPIVIKVKGDPKAIEPPMVLSERRGDTFLKNAIKLNFSYIF